MNSRIRNKVELIRQSDAKLEDNLSQLDLQIHKMLPVVGYQILNKELTDFDDPYTGTVNDNLQCSSVEINGETVDYQFLENINDTEEQQNDNNEIASYEVSRSTLVVQTAEELEECMNSPLIIEDLYQEDPSDETTHTNIGGNIEGIGPCNEDENGLNNGRDNRNKQAVTSAEKLTNKWSKQTVKTAKPLENVKVNGRDNLTNQAITSRPKLSINSSKQAAKTVKSMETGKVSKRRLPFLQELFY